MIQDGQHEGGSLAGPGLGGGDEVAAGEGGGDGLGLNGGWLKVTHFTGGLHQLLDLPGGIARALIITPTRELAQQIDDVCLALAYHTPVRVGLLVGGASPGPQEKALRAGVEVLLATPGRLLDHMRQNQARFDRLHPLVLDEADRMLDMGFLPDLKRIVALSLIHISEPTRPY